MDPKCSRDLGSKIYRALFAADTQVSKLWSSELGKLVLELEVPRINQQIRRLHGETVIWAGDGPGIEQLLDGCMVKNRLILKSAIAGGLEDVSCPVGSLALNQPTLPRGAVDPSVVQSGLEALPFRSGSIDGIVLHHALERVRDPRTALREVTRVLAPGGRLLIAGFNPISLLGSKRLYSKFFQDPLSAHRFVNPLRLFDWLAVLGFELQTRPVYFASGLPLGRIARRFSSVHAGVSDVGVRWALPFGGLMIVEAVKHSSAMSRPWPHHVQTRRLAPVAYPRVSSWQRGSDPG